MSHAVASLQAQLERANAVIAAYENATEKLVIALNKYASKDNWEPRLQVDGTDSVFNALVNEDEEVLVGRGYGGKCARIAIKNFNAWKRQWSN